MKIIFYYKSSEDIWRYKVKIKGDRIVVKDKSQGLYPEYYNRKVCEIFNNGNFLEIQVGEKKIELDSCEAQALLTALLAESLEYGYKIKIK